MNTTPHDNNRERDDMRFDAAMRELHAASVARVSPQIRWKLRPTPAMTGGVAGRFGGTPIKSWLTGAAYAAVTAGVFAVAIGVGLREPDPAAGSAPVLAATQPGSATVGVLDQDPEFFAWLASDDAMIVAAVE